MLNRWKRLLALLASVAVLFSLCTAASAAPGEQAEPRELTAADYAAADAIFASLPSADGTNGGTAGAADTGALCDWLETADGVRPGTVSANGSCVTWQTDAGITCSYNPQLERISERAQEPAQTQTLESIPALRGVRHGRDVYLFQPYYGLDSSFTRQYYEEGQRIVRSTIIRRRLQRSTPLPMRSNPAVSSCLTATAPRTIPATMRTTPPKRRRPTSACRAARA